MTVLFMDSMRSYAAVSGASVGLTSIYSVLAVASNLDFVAGRYAARYLRLTSSSGLRSINWSPVSVENTLFAGMDYQCGQLPGSDAAMLRFNRGGGSNPQVTFAVTPLGAIRAYRGSTSGTVLGTSANGMVNAGFLAHFEFRAKIDSTDGEITVWRNGTQILDITNENTQGQASAGIDQVGWVLSNSVYNGSVDTKLGANFVSTTRCGVCKIETLNPQADYAVSWTPTSGSDNFAMLNSTTIDTATEVSTATLNNVDLYTMTDLPVEPLSVYAVQWRGVGRRSLSGTRLQAVLEVGGDQWLGAEVNTGSTAFRPFEEIRSVQPNNGPWNFASVNALRAGVKKPVSTGVSGLCHLMCEVLVSLALAPGAPLVPGVPTGRRVLQIVS